ncbi:unnamed protein product, partial [Porites lobata]
LRTEFPLVEEELLLYSLTYYPMVNAIDSVYHVQFDINDLRNYFYRVTNNLVKGLGIVNGTVHWMYYKESAVEVLNGFKPVLEELLIDSNSVERDRVENLRSVLSKECSKLVESSNSASADVTVVSQDTRSGSEMLDLENIEQKSLDEKNDESTAKLKPGQTFAVMSKEELLKITRQQSSELKALHKR